MNKEGDGYISTRNKYIKILPKELRKKLSKLNWEDSEIQERMMRLGLEVSSYEIDIDNTNDMIDMARATIIEDYVQRLIKRQSI